MKSLTESIIGTNNAGIFSEEVFNKRVREEFEKAFKNLVNFKHMYKDPLEYSDMGSGYFVHGWAVTSRKSDDEIDQAFDEAMEKFTKSIKQYKPLVNKESDVFEESVIKAYEIRLQEYPDVWYDEPTFNIFFSEDIDNITHSRFWLIIGYDDIGMDDIFDQKK